jgi:Flp pilus assembly protein TadB
MVSLRYITSKEIIIMVEFLGGVGVGYAAIFMPVLLLFVIFYFDNKTKKEKYNAMIEISKNLKDPSEIKELLEDFKEKKEPIDFRRSGVITLFVGIGLFLFGIFFIGILKGVGLLVGTIGVGSLIAGYLYPNESAEITKAVENFEKK